MSALEQWAESDLLAPREGVVRLLRPSPGYGPVWLMGSGGFPALLKLFGVHDPLSPYRAPML